MLTTFKRSRAALIICIIFVAACNDKNIVGPALITNHINFPEFFIEKGSDVDSSYISFRGIKMNNDTLMIEGTSWGVIEYGLFIGREDFNQRILYRFMGQCGTVSNRTWKKVTIANYLTAAETDTLWELGFTNFLDTLSIVKVTIN